MLKSSKLGDSVASEMDKILNSQEFQSIYEPDHIVAADYSGVLSSDPGYKAFVRVASKKTCEEPECKEKGKGKEKEPAKEEKGKGKKGKLPPWLAKGKKDKKEAKKEAAEALGYILNSLTQTSEVLDNLGLAKSATITLALANGIMKEAAEMGDESWEYEGPDEYGIEGEGEAFEADPVEGDPELVAQMGERIPSELEVDEDPYIGSLDEEGWQPPIDPDRERFGSDDVADAKDKKDKKDKKEKEDDKEEEEEEDEDEDKDDEDEKEDEDDCGNYLKASKKNRKKVAQLTLDKNETEKELQTELQNLINKSKNNVLTEEEQKRFKYLRDLFTLQPGNLPVGQPPATPLTSSKVTDPQILTLVADINNWLKK